MIKGEAGQFIGGQLINASTGAAYVGTITVYITGDGQSQVIGTTNSGICTSQGNGYYNYQPTAAETNFNLVAFTFVGSGAIDATIQVATVSPAQQQALQPVTGPGAPTLTVSGLITASLRRINVIQGNDDAPDELMQTGFDRVNDLLDAWQNERLLIYTITPSTWNFVSGQASYTVGIGGDIDVQRPLSILGVNWQDTSLNPVVEVPLIPLTDTAYMAVPIKSQTATIPTYFYYNPTFGASGYATLTVWLVPTSPTLQGILYAPQAVPTFNALTDLVFLPPGYRRFLRDNLALELAAELRDGIPVDPGLVRSAMESKATVKRSNIRIMDMSIDSMWLPHGGVRSNIYVGN